MYRTVLERLRYENVESVADLAKRVGLSETTIRATETRSLKPGRKTIARLEHAFRTDIKTLLSKPKQVTY